MINTEYAAQQARNQGFANNAIDREPTFTEKTVNQIGELNATQLDTIQRLTEINDRLFGQGPPSGEAKSALHPVAPGKASEIEDGLTASQRYAHTIQSLASQLMSRV